MASSKGLADTFRNDFPKRAAIVFEDVSLANYARPEAPATSQEKTKTVKMAREMSSYFRSQYDRAYGLPAWAVDIHSISNHNFKPNALLTFQPCLVVVMAAFFAFFFSWSSGPP